MEIRIQIGISLARSVIVGVICRIVQGRGKHGCEFEIRVILVAIEKREIHRVGVIKKMYKGSFGREKQNLIISNVGKKSLLKRIAICIKNITLGT